MPFVHRVPWVLHEAFDAGKWFLSSTVKAIISGDSIQVNMKGGKLFTIEPTVPIFWGANADPQFKEATKAITNRIAVMECRREFDEDNPVGAAAEARRRGFDKPSSLVLATEMEGVLAWAIEGLKRLLGRGHFVLPEESKAAAEVIRLNANIVAGFVESCITFNPNGMVSTADFCAAFTSFWLEQKGEDRLARQREGRLGAAASTSPGSPPTARNCAPRPGATTPGSGSMAMARGIGTTRFHRRHFNFRARPPAPARRTKTQIGPFRQNGHKEAIQAMRTAHEKMRARTQTGHLASGHHENRSPDDVTDGAVTENSDIEELSSPQLSDPSRKPVL